MRKMWLSSYGRNWHKLAERFIMGVIPGSSSERLTAAWRLAYKRFYSLS